MTRRTVTIIIVLFDAAAGGVIAAVLFALTGAPSLGLTGLGKTPRAALAFAFAFPALLAALFIATVAYFAA